MLLTTLFEDAQTDTSAHIEADDIVRAVINHFRVSNPENYYGTQLKRFSDGKIFLTIQGRDIGLTGVHARVWFWFGEQTEGYEPKGFFSRLSLSQDPVIAVIGFDNLQDIAGVANRIVNQHHIHTVLYHETAHYLDSFRNPTILKQGQAKMGPAYTNDPRELNAYFHNLANPLLNLLKLCAERPNDPALKRYAADIGITNDFQETCLNLVDHATKFYPVERFVRDLSERNRKAVVKRLYALYQKAMEALNRSGSAEIAASCPLLPRQCLSGEGAGSGVGCGAGGASASPAIR